MEVYKVDGSNSGERISRNISEDDLRTEFAFLIAERLSVKLLEKGLITQQQHKVFMDSNARSFPGTISSLYRLKTCNIKR